MTIIIIIIKNLINNSWTKYKEEILKCLMNVCISDTN